MTEYQPRWVGGQEVGTGIRKASSRYEAIAAKLSGHSGFTVLDVGAYNAYFSLRLAHEFDATCVAADSYRGLRGALDEAGDERVTGLFERLTPARVTELAEQQGGFDVVLCLSVLHHMPDWADMLAAVADAGRVLFIETAVPSETLPKAVAHGDSAAINDAVAELAEQRGGEVIARTHGYKSRKQRPLTMIGTLD